MTDNRRTPDFAAMLGLITRLKQVCNYEPSSCESVKFEALSVLLENLVGENDKVIIFSQFVECLRWLAARLKLSVTEIYHGALNEAKRDRILRRFKNEPGPRVLLMSIKAGGVGLNLPEASTVVLFDRWWNPATENQAIQRAHRFGRTAPLHVVRFLVKNSIEERIDEILVKKSRLFQAYVEGAESTSFGTVARKQLLQLLK